jgi:hypothetical protein
MASEAEVELIEALRPSAKRKPREKLIVRMGSSDRCLLDDAARARGTTTALLAGKLLKVVARDRLFDAVLDGDK